MLMNPNQYYSAYQQNSETAAWLRSERIAYCEQPLVKQGKGVAKVVRNIVHTFLSILF